MAQVEKGSFFISCIKLIRSTGKHSYNREWAEMLQIAPFKTRFTTIGLKSKCFNDISNTVKHNLAGLNHDGV